MHPYTSAIKTRDGLSLRSELWGDLRDPPVVLAHGGAQTRHSWKGTARALARSGWRVVAFDMQGHGESDWSPDGAYEIEAFAQDLIAVAEFTGEAPALVGASLGGLAGLVAEGELSPGSFRSLTLVDIAPEMNPAGITRIIGFMGENADGGFDSVESAVAAIAAYMPHRAAAPVSDSLSRYLRQCGDGRYRLH